MKLKTKRPPSAALTCLGGLGCTGTPEITLKAKCTSSVPGDVRRNASAGEITLMRKTIVFHSALPESGCIGGLSR
jgi:hypothetical protein